MFSDKLRAYAVAAVSWVDYVVITDSQSAVEVIRRLRPTFYIKGPDFIHKKTPGIESERNAVWAIGGKTVYTRDPKVSTTEIIRYIKHEIPERRLLVVTDRDGTVVSPVAFLGRTADWRKRTTINRAVASFLSYLTARFDTTIIGVTNQSGVARGYFPEIRVREIHARIDRDRTDFNVRITRWEYCPDADSEFADKHPEIPWNGNYVKRQSKRKPSPRHGG